VCVVWSASHNTRALAQCWLMMSKVEMSAAPYTFQEPGTWLCLVIWVTSTGR